MVEINDGEHDPLLEEPEAEAFFPSPPKPLGPLSHKPTLYHSFPVVYLLIAMAITSTAYWQSPWHDMLWLSQRSIRQHQEYWRLITSLLAHSGPGHFLSNVPFLFIFGWFLRHYFGRLAFPVLPIIVGMMASLATVTFYPMDARLIGASGVVYAMVALWVLLYVRFETAHSLPMRIFRAFGFCLILLFPTTYHQQTSYLSHSFGFLFGLLAGLIFWNWLHLRDHLTP